MGQPLAFIGLGSNLGEPERQLDRALSGLAKRGVDIHLLSSWYRTEPLGGPSQPWFVNGAAGARFDGSAEELLAICQAIESDQGRRRTVVHGPRTLDLDLLLFGARVSSSPELTLPHPGLSARRFVLVPMVEIAGDVLDPKTGLSLRELLARCPDRSAVRRLGPPGLRSAID